MHRLKKHVYVDHACAGDPPPDVQIEAETSDDEDAQLTCHDEMLLAIASIRVGY